MRAVVQRVLWAKVEIDGRVHGEISQGFLLLLGITHEDTENEAKILAKKATELRVFEDENGKMNRSLQDIGGGMLIVPNFTLYADTSHGRRPSFIGAARPEKAEPLYEYFIELVRQSGMYTVQTGEFGADMKVSLLNDGPVTLILDTKDYL